VSRSCSDADAQRLHSVPDKPYILLAYSDDLEVGQPTRAGLQRQVLCYDHGSHALIPRAWLLYSPQARSEKLILTPGRSKLIDHHLTD
jgi:hypothetical protein